MHERKPEWLRVRVNGGSKREEVEEILKRLSLHTVCEQASCPNIMECFGRKTATFMILGKVCTRNCTFCDVRKGRPDMVDADEPLHVAQAVRELNLRHVVVTSVTRDDLAYGGAEHYAAVIGKVRELNPEVVIEVLIPDFKGSYDALSTVIDARPDILNHNVETVPRLYPEVRPMAVYRRSLELLQNVKKMCKDTYTKSGIMLGLGENEQEVLGVFRDLREAGCDFLTAGQYLAPSKSHHPVVEYVRPDVFESYKAKALDMGFKYVASAPLVRSSYQADKAMKMSEL
ncbi:MAG: lipoyl synthase [Ruminiclostridium sp.]|nr:lipoyl synthase [Ruminiclostridium sp.]